MLCHVTDRISTCSTDDSVICDLAFFYFVLYLSSSSLCHHCPQINSNQHHHSCLNLSPRETSGGNAVQLEKASKWKIYLYLGNVMFVLGTWTHQAITSHSLATWPLFFIITCRHKLGQGGGVDAAHGFHGNIYSIHLRETVPCDFS